MDTGAWRATVHGVAKSRTRLSDFTFTFFLSDSPSWFLFTFGQLSRFFFPRTLPNIYMYFLLRWIPPQRTMDAGPHLLWGGIPSLFNPQGAFRCMCGEGSIPELRSGHLIPSLQQSSDSATSFVLGVSG